MCEGFAVPDVEDDDQAAGKCRVRPALWRGRGGGERTRVDGTRSSWVRWMPAFQDREEKGMAGQDNWKRRTSTRGGST